MQDVLQNGFSPFQECGIGGIPEHGKKVPVAWAYSGCKWNGIGGLGTGSDDRSPAAFVLLTAVVTEDTSHPGVEASDAGVLL
jgi:hypothetical protein